jgi:anti-sigma factor RsiW
MRNDGHEMDAHPEGRCGDLMLQICRYLDEDVTPRERRVIAQHLARCGRCRAFSSSMRRTVRICGAVGAPELSGAAKARARARIAALLRPRLRKGKTTKATTLIKKSSI